MLAGNPVIGISAQSFAIITIHGIEIPADFNGNYNDKEVGRMPVILGGQAVKVS
jgi:hypothetical protein